MNKADMIESVLLKHIIEAQRGNTKEDISENQRRFRARWYLINSTDSYRGLMNGINELIAGRTVGIDEIEKLRDALSDLYLSITDERFCNSKETALDNAKQLLNNPKPNTV